MLERHEAAECKLTRARGVSALSQRDQGSAKATARLAASSPLFFSSPRMATQPPR